MLLHAERLVDDSFASRCRRANYEFFTVFGQFPKFLNQSSALVSVDFHHSSSLEILMSRIPKVLCIAASLALVVDLACGLAFYLFEPESARSSPGEPAPQSSDDSVTYLDQAWPQADREWYYQMSQGSTVISYDIFLNLEVAGSQELFRSDANS